VNDPIRIVFEFLTEPGTPLFEAVGNRVWCPVAPEGFDNTQPALIYHPDSEVPEAPVNVLANSLVFKCYGGAATFGSARVLAQALYDRLHGASGVTASGRIIRSRCVHMQQAGNEPETGYPVHIAQYQVITH
jgi:hypothetical protein